MVETIDEGAATLADDGTVLYANRSFAEIFDVPLEKFIGAPLNDSVFGEDRNLLDNLVADANNSIVRGEIRLDSRKSRPRTIRLTLSPTREHGVHTICVVATELTELIETNEALRVSELSLRQLSARLLKLQDEERRRIARDLHDTTGQKIAVLSMTLDRLAKVLDSKKQSVEDALAECREMVGKIGEEIRTLSYFLHPPLLDECGLASAVLWYIEGFKKRSGIQLNVSIDEELVRLSTDAETALFRVLQESLTNVHRYSGSASADIRIFRSAGSVHLEIVDYGKGIRAATDRSAFSGTPTLGWVSPACANASASLAANWKSNLAMKARACTPRCPSRPCHRSPLNNPRPLFLANPRRIHRLHSRLAEPACAIPIDILGRLQSARGIARTI